MPMAMISPGTQTDTDEVVSWHLIFFVDGATDAGDIINGDMISSMRE